MGMKIAIVTFLLFDFPGIDAHSRRIEMLSRGLAERGHDVTIVSPLRLNPGPREKVVDNIRVIWCYSPNEWPIPARKQLLGRWHLLRWINLNAKQDGLDWILVYNMSVSGIFISLVTRWRKKLFGTIRGEAIRVSENASLYLRISRLLFRFADFILPKMSHLNIVDTPYLEDRAKRYAPKVPTVRVPALIDPENFKPDSVGAVHFRDKWNLDDRILIGHTGTYATTHGNATLLKAVKLLVAQGYDVKLLLAGRSLNNIECDDIPLLVKDLGLGNHVITPGYLGTKDLIAALTACDILALPRLNHLVNIASSPTKLPEYMAVGKAVVASHIGDIPSHIQHEVNGLLVQPGNVDELANELARLIDSPNLRRKLGIEAQKTVEQVFHYRIAGQQIEKALLSAQNQFRQNRPISG